MRIAILSESPADEAAIRILVEAILHEPLELVSSPPLRARGWPSVSQILPGVIKYLYYRTDAEALVVVVDSNRSPAHQDAPNQQCQGDNKCRLCQMRETVARVLAALSPVAGRDRIKVAVGLAVPTIEAWYLRGKKSGVSERAWFGGLEFGKLPYDKNQLKRDVYGTDRPSLALETRRAEEEARRIAQDLDRLEQQFPVGFGSLANEIRRWQ